MNLFYAQPHALVLCPLADCRYEKLHFFTYICFLGSSDMLALKSNARMKWIQFEDLLRRATTKFLADFETLQAACRLSKEIHRPWIRCNDQISSRFFSVPVVPHQAVAEVSRIGHHRRGELL